MGSLFAFLSYFHISRKEIESLSDTKRGWKKPLKGNTSSFLLKDESRSSQGTKNLLRPRQDQEVPSTSMAFQRDWRRLNNSEKKLEYFSHIM